MLPPHESGPRRTLNGWKEIAAYLGKSVRSVQRWESSLALPIRRIKTPDGQIVYAETDEIDEWRQSLDSTPVTKPTIPFDFDAIPGSANHVADPAARSLTTHRHLRGWATVAAALGIFVAGAIWGRWHTKADVVPITYRLADRALEAINSHGAVIWTYRFERSVTHVTRRGERMQFPEVDVDGDGETEVLVFVRFSQQGRPPELSDSLFCFGRTGRLQWRVTPDQSLSFSGQVFSAPWVIEDLAVSESPQARRLWLALSHQTWWPSFVLEIAGETGTARVRYTQAGRIFSVAHWRTPSGGVLAIGGALQAKGESLLALLPDEDPPSSFPGRGTRDYHCEKCADARPRRVFAFSPSEMSRLYPDRHPFVSNLTVAGERLKVNLSEGITFGGQHAVAFVAPNQTISSLSFSDAYWRGHRELYQAGVIDHGPDECPERGRTRVVREWTPEGWQDVSVAPEAAAHGPGS